MIEPPGPLAFPPMGPGEIPLAPELLAYAELRYRGTAQALEAAEILLPKVLGDDALTRSSSASCPASREAFVPSTLD